MSRIYLSHNRLCAVLVGGRGANHSNDVVTVMGNASMEDIASMLLHFSQHEQFRMERVAVSVTPGVRRVTHIYFPTTHHIASHFRIRGLTFRTLRRVHIGTH